MEFTTSVPVVGNAYPIFLNQEYNDKEYVRHVSVLNLYNGADLPLFLWKEWTNNKEARGSVFSPVTDYIIEAMEPREVNAAPCQFFARGSDGTWISLGPSGESYILDVDLKLFHIAHNLRETE